MAETQSHRKKMGQYIMASKTCTQVTKNQRTPAGDHGREYKEAGSHTALTAITPKGQESLTGLPTAPAAFVDSAALFECKLFIKMHLTDPTSDFDFHPSICSANLQECFLLGSSISLTVQKKA